MGKLKVEVEAKLPLAVCERPSFSGTWCCLDGSSSRVRNLEAKRMLANTRKSKFWALTTTCCGPSIGFDSSL